MKWMSNSSPVGQMMIFEGMLLLAPLLLLPMFPGEGELAWTFLFPAVVAIVVGLFCCYLKISIKSSSRFVVFVWLFGILLGAIPFVLWDQELPFIHALFESVSGFTTTGLSVLDVEAMPSLFLFYRSFIQYVGGLGFIMTIMVFVQGRKAVDYYHAEGHVDRIMPNIGGTVRTILKLYGAFLLLGTAALWCSGMPLFDSLLHAMCALSTGGFSNRMASIGYYDSIPIEIVTCILMFIGTTNFALLLLLCKGKIKEVFRSSECIMIGLLMAMVMPFMMFDFSRQGIPFLESLRTSVFNGFSAISTTGYATADYSTWPEVSIASMIVLMLIGGGLGSTAGGMKLGRVYIAAKHWLHMVKKRIFPNYGVTLLYYKKGCEQEIVTKEQLQEAYTYILTYGFIYLLGTFLFACMSGATLLESGFEFASSLGTVGLSIGITNAQLPVGCLILEMIGMLLGRLEIFVLLKVLCFR